MLQEQTPTKLGEIPITQATNDLLYELKIENLPPSLANDEFIHYLSSTHGVENPVLVHTQLPNNQKILILRMRQKDIFQKLDCLTAIYKGNQIQFSSYYRTITKQINRALKKTRGITRDSPLPHYYRKISTVHLNNIPHNLKASLVKKAMEKFGRIEGIRIYEKGELKEKNRTKCRICTVTYSNFRDAVDAYYQDKVKIGRNSLKVKLYIHRNFEKNKEDNPRDKEHPQAQGSTRGYAMGSKAHKSFTESVKEGEELRDDQAKAGADSQAKEEHANRFDLGLRQAAQYGSRVRQTRPQTLSNTLMTQQRRLGISQDQVIPTAYGNANRSRRSFGALIPMRPLPVYSLPPAAVPLKNWQRTDNLEDKRSSMMQNLVFLLESKPVEKFKYKQGLSLVLVKERHIAENLRYNNGSHAQPFGYMGYGLTNQQVQTRQFGKVEQTPNTRGITNFASNDVDVNKEGYQVNSLGDQNEGMVRGPQHL